LGFLFPPHPVTAAQNAYPPGESRRIFKISKFIVRYLSLGKISNSWRRLLASKEMSSFLRAHGRMHLKIQRPYLCHRLSPPQVFEALNNHYRFILGIFTEASLEVLATRGILLYRGNPSGNESVELVLAANVWEQEGELGLVLKTAKSGRILATLVFTVHQFTSESGEIFVGGLQGRNDEFNREALVSMTKSMHGLRPKSLLLFALQECAATWGLDSIRCVSNELHVFRSWRKRKHVSADYDAFWVESGGVRQPDGCYLISPRFQMRSPESIRPNKRSQYRKRYQLMEEISKSLRVALNSHASSLGSV
jgi:uncharacterized protein